jgi:hypothetical protein
MYIYFKKFFLNLKIFIKLIKLIFLIKKIKIENKSVNPAYKNKKILRIINYKKVLICDIFFDI